MDSINTFMQLLRSSLWGTPLDLQGQNWTHEQYQAVMDLARAQAVVGLVAQALVDAGVRMEKQDALALYKFIQKIRQRNAVLDKSVVSLCRGLKKREVRVFVFKGQTLAAMYPDGGLRQSGDIDFACHPDDWDRCLHIFKDELKLPLIDNITEKHVGFKAKGVEYELHRKLAAFSNPRHRRYWAETVMPELLKTLTTVRINEEEVPTLHPTYNALYVFVHIFYHLLDEGVGLRQFCDWAVTVQNGQLTMDNGQLTMDNGQWIMENGECAIDKVLLEKHLTGLGLMKAYTGLGAILTDYLGLPESAFPFPISSADHERAGALFQNMLEMGNFGHNKQYVRQSGVLHAIQHLGRITMQSRRFYAYAPSEAWWRIPYMLHWWWQKIGLKFSR